MSEEECVRNSIHLDSENGLVIMSGSNMSGKSTFLRTIGANTVLALAGAPVRAREMQLSPFTIAASIQVRDSLQEGVSKFYAEIKRVREMMDKSKEPKPLLFLIDEIFQGTNSHDRRIAAGAILRKLVKNGAVGVITTHDLALTKIADELSPRARNVHFEDRVVEGKMVFDYKLRPGVIQHGNALFLLRSIGLEV
jgi:DNA mismatch repair ATPase MutS